MKKIIVMLTGLLLMAGAAYAHHFSAIEKTGDITVKASIDNNPVKVGDNGITLEIFDAETQPVADADVSVYYFMPSMPAMNYEVKAEWDGKRYTSSIKPTMPGEWVMQVKIGRGGEKKQVSIGFEAK